MDAIRDILLKWTHTLMRKELGKRMINLGVSQKNIVSESCSKTNIYSNAIGLS